MTDQYVRMVNGEPVPMTAEEIAERQAEENAPPPPLPLETQLSNIYDAQSVDVRASLAPLRAAVKLELELGHYDVVLAIIQNATIPAELETVRTQLLGVLA